MTIKLTCPHCGPVHYCDRCGKAISNPASRIEAKVVTGDRIARSPVIWGEWCSFDCFLAAVEEVFAPEVQVA